MFNVCSLCEDLLITRRVRLVHSPLLLHGGGAPPRAGGDVTVVGVTPRAGAQPAEPALRLAQVAGPRVEVCVLRTIAGHAFWWLTWREMRQIFR